MTAEQSDFARLIELRNSVTDAFIKAQHEMTTLFQAIASPEGAVEDIRIGVDLSLLQLADVCREVGREVSSVVNVKEYFGESL